MVLIVVFKVVPVSDTDNGTIVYICILLLLLLLLLLLFNQSAFPQLRQVMQVHNRVPVRQLQQVGYRPDTFLLQHQHTGETCFHMIVKVYIHL